MPPDLVANPNRFADNVDTRGALDALRDLIATCNVYLRDRRVASEPPNCLILRDVAAYITHIMSVFGAISADAAIGFPIAGAGDAGNVC